MLNLLFAFGLGVIIGSFLNVCIYRLPQGENLIYPGSHCTTCGHDLGPFDLVPVISYIALKGKCRHCGEKVSPRYMLVELVTGFLYGVLYHQWGWSLEWALYALFVSLLIVLTCIDWEHMLLPTPIITFGLVIGLILRGLQAARYQNSAFLWAPLVGAALGFGIFALLFYGGRWLYKKECLGFGDVRLMALIGLYVSIDLLFFTLFLASILAAIYGVFQLWRRKRSEAYPFAPFINGAALIAVLYGYTILDWYCNLRGIAL